MRRITAFATYVAQKFKCHGQKTPKDRKQIAKANRVNAKHIGAGHTANPLPGGRKSKWKVKVTGAVVLRDAR